MTPAAAAVALWVVVFSGEWLTGILPGLVAGLVVVGDLLLWRRRHRPWHDGQVIAGLMPALAAGLWIGIGGLALGVHRGAAGRLLLEVGPGLALTGLVTTVASYHGRHDPRA